MASVDGSKSLHGACDEVFDIVCAPCKTVSLEKEAKFYCTDCNENLCADCKDSHLKFKMSKHHKILSSIKSQKQATSPQPPSSGIHVYCSCNQNQEVFIYCERHDEVICHSCKMIKHRNCKLYSVQEKGTDYNSTRLTVIITKAKSLKNKAEQLHKQVKDSQTKLTTLKAVCKKDIANFREEIRALFDNYEEDLLADLDKSLKQQQLDIDRQISSLETTQNLLDHDYKVLEDAKQDGRNETMFAAEIKVSKGLMEYDGLIKELQKEVVSPVLSFERNQKICDMHTEVRSLGYIKCKNVMLGMKKKSSRQVNVKLAEDSSPPIINGCIFMSNKYFVLCDRANYNIKLFYDAINYEAKLKLSSWPGDIDKIDDDNIIVTLPDTKQLRYIQVFPKFETGRIIQLERGCYGVAVSSNEIFATCHNNPGQGEVCVFDLSGNLRRKIGVNTQGLFKSPNFIAVSESSSNLFQTTLAVQ